jgi:DNA polymerase epsilon subunit 1
MRYRFLYLR